jgi:hypothetical protein
MTEKEKLIQKARKMNPTADQESFYRFALEYLNSAAGNGETNPTEFYKLIENIQKNQKKRTVKIAMGISGGNFKALDKWCDGIKVYKTSVLGQLTVKELCYVMGYCARIAKCESTSKNNSGYSNKTHGNYRHQKH